ncbi:MAG: OadG family protein [Bacillota bacterium]|jgi:sodium pump decarboxylase gamma subunit
MDKLLLGINLAALGVGVVFTVLILLQLVMEAEHQAVERLLQKTKPKTAYGGSKSGDLPPKTKRTSPTVADKKLSPEKIAVIAASLAAVMGEEQKYRLISIRRLEKEKPGNPWSFAGRTEIITKRINYTNKGGQH